MNADNVAPPMERPKIILVEDDPAVRRSLQLLLQGRGYAIRSYASSAALRADLTTADAACLVTDFRMPELDGFAVLRTLREPRLAGARDPDHRIFLPQSG
jgi:FixJ family two-component response regulator